MFSAPTRKSSSPLDRKSIYEWAVEYCGDPASHVTRGNMLTEVLCEQGLKPHHQVLDLGCGALSTGVPLIRYLNEGNYVGLDPNGWLIEAALQENSDLLAKNPIFLYNSDFTITRGGPFDYVIAHSVLSHAAYWQLEQALANVRRDCNEGAIWLASLRLDQYDLWNRQWQYPGVSYFRFDTVRVIGFYAGWHVEQAHWLRECLTDKCPNDFHDWVKLTAIPTTEEMNQLRLTEEKWRKRDADVMKKAEEVYAEGLGVRVNELRRRIDG